MRNRTMLVYVGIGAVIWTTFAVLVQPNPIDLTVYEYGGEIAFQRGDLYQPRDGLPFTYAPFAAVVFIPFAWMPMWVDVIIMALASYLALARVMWLLYSNSVRVPNRAVYLGLIVVALALEPTWANFSFGQINLLLMWLVVEDVFARWPGKGAGIMTGLAAGLKLTPAIFITMFAAAQKWRIAIMAIVGGIITLVVPMIIVGPSQVVDYYTKILWDTSRVGSPGYAGNQSMDGAILRLFGGEAPRFLWALAALVVFCAAMWTAYQYWRTDKLRAFATTALAMLLISPISWTHHWVWALAALVWLLAVRTNGSLTILGIGIFFFLVRITWWQPNGGDVEYTWSWWQQALGNAYVFWAIAAFLYLVLSSAKSDRAASEESDSPQTQSPSTTK